MLSVTCYNISHPGLGAGGEQPFLKGTKSFYPPSNTKAKYHLSLRKYDLTVTEKLSITKFI